MLFIRQEAENGLAFGAPYFTRFFVVSISFILDLFFCVVSLMFLSCSYCIVEVVSTYQFTFPLVIPLIFSSLDPS